jgi:Catalase
MRRDGYLLYEPSVEETQPGEQETIRAIVHSIDKTNASSFATRGHAIRQQHAKGQGFLKGELTVYGDLPQHLRQGMFATARSYPIIVRLSTAFGDLRSDRIRVARGMAIKVLGVEGTKALPAEDSSASQDFLLVNHKSYFSDATAYLRLQRAFEWQPSVPDLVLRGVGLLARGARKIADCAGFVLPMDVNTLADPGNNILGESFYSQAAIRFGTYIARLCAAPVSDSVLQLKGLSANAGDDVIRNFVVEFFRNNAAEYELRAQLGTDLRRTPVEDASIEWPEEVSPHQPIGRITLPAQEADSPARRAYSDDTLSFNPWQCLADHQPLGSIMRIRKEAYRTSSTFRHKMNKQLMIEPRDISEFPD